MCHVFPPLVSIYGLFPVLVSCHYELSMFQLCLSRYVLITLCILVLSFEFDFVWSTHYFPGVSCPCQSCLDVSIKYYYLSLRPRLRVPVPPSCVHRDRRPDLTVSGAPSPRFVFLFSKVFCFDLFVSVPRQGSRHPSFRPSPRQDGVGVRRDRRYSKPSDSMPAGPPLTQCPPDRR